eukprot:TRINITY_DN2003_c0_g1_i1.p1 TRINITY_DN2003_c0_g1~~TRINITY_DN2003_c0_g1_i1.p1  ORF type:complete len:221 (+),score=57.34 TRINITY_DN2003_c0_g1_i1:49-663(+)
MSIMEYNGGAVVAMTGKDCVAIASDMRFGQQFQTIATSKPKVYAMGDRVLLGLTGLATDTQTVYEKLKFRTNTYKLREEREISPQALAALTSNLLYERRFGPYFVEPVVAGLDEHGKPYLNAMDLIGAGCEAADFVVAGTCSESLFGMCESLWKPELEAEDLFETIGQALLSALDRDCLSGWGGVVILLTKDKIVTREIKGRYD